MKGGLTALYWVHQGNTFLLSGIFVYKHISSLLWRYSISGTSDYNLCCIPISTYKCMCQTDGQRWVPERVGVQIQMSYACNWQSERSE